MILFPDMREAFINFLPKNSIACEIGVAEGEFSTHLLQITQPQKLHLIDPWIFQERDDYQNDFNNVNNDEGEKRFRDVTNMFQNQIDAGQVEIHRAFSYDVVDQFPDAYFDWIYVDAVHSYEGAKKDLEVFLPKVKADGFILGHDYANHIHARSMGFGVVEAVDEFCLENDLEFLALTTDSFPTFVLTRNIESDHAKLMISKILYDVKIISEIEGHPRHTVIQQDLCKIGEQLVIRARFKQRN